MLAGAQYTEPRHLEPADAASDPPGASNKRPETSNARLDALQGRPDGDAQSSGELHEPQTSAAAARADVVVLDVRNDYEWDAGHFQGADRPQEVGNCAHAGHVQYVSCLGMNCVLTIEDYKKAVQSGAIAAVFTWLQLAKHATRLSEGPTGRRLWCLFLQLGFWQTVLVWSAAMLQ